MTTAGKVKIGLALNSDTYEQLKEMASGPRAVGSLVENLVRAEVERRTGSQSDLHQTPSAQKAGSHEEKRQQPKRRLSDATRQLDRRDERLKILHEIDRAILAARSTSEIAEAAAQGVLRATNVAGVWIALWNSDDEILQLLAAAGINIPSFDAGTKFSTRDGYWYALVHRTDPLVIEDVACEPDLLPESQAALALDVHAWVVIPLLVAGRPIGMVAGAGFRPGRLPDHDLALIQQVADSLAVAMHNAHLNAEVQDRRRELQALSRRLVELQEQERRALSRDLHDTSGQNITALKLGLSALKRENDRYPAAGAKVDELLELADTVSEDLHRLAVNLRPASLDRYGLVPALVQLLTEFQKQSGLQVSFDAQGIAESADRLPGDAETTLYRIVQEALTNIKRYAQASAISVVLQNREEWVQVAVEDDGQGFDVDRALHSGRLGLLGMRERAEMAGGMLEIESSPGRGTTIYATVPSQPVGIERDSTERPEPGRFAAPASDSAENVAEMDSHLAEAAETIRAKTLSDALVEITAAIARCESADEILRVVLARSAETIGSDNAHIARRRGDGWEILYIYQERLDRQQISDLDAPAFDAVEQTCQVLIVNDTSAVDLRDALRLETHHVKSYASLPLLAGERLLGILSFVNYSISGTFHPSEVVFLNHLAALVTPALENIQLREITTRQRDELAQRVEELQTVLELLPAGVLIARDPQCKKMEPNPAFADLMGIPRGANASLSADEAERPRGFKICRNGVELAPEEMPMQVAARQGIPVRYADYDVVRDDGTISAMMGSAVPLFDAEHKPRGAVGAFVDTTEARRAQVQTEAARRTLEALLNYIPEGITIADAPSETIRYTSRYAQEVLGGPHHDKTPAEVAGQWAVFEPDGVTLMADADLPLVRAIRRGDTVADKELIQVNAEGRRLTLLCNAGPIRDREGNITGGIVAWRDIAGVKETREALQRSVAERDAILSSIADGLIVYDLAGQIIRMNATAEEMLGFSPELRVLGLTDRLSRGIQLLKPDRSPLSPAEFPVVQALQGEVIRNQELILQVASQSGGELRLSVSAAPIRGDGGMVTGCVATFSNIEAFYEATERLSQREAALRKANAELEAILSALPDGLIVYDAAGKIARMNDRALAMLGYREDTWRLPVDERVASAVQAFRPDGSICTRDEYVSLRALRGENVRNENQYIHLPENPVKDFWGMFSASPILGNEGQTLGAVTTLIDTTPLHQISEQLAQANALLQKQAGELRSAAESLEQRVQERTAELEAIFASLPDAVYVGNQHGITRCNRIALDNLGCATVEELQLRLTEVNARLERRDADSGEIIPPDKEAFNIALNGQPHTAEIISRHPMTGLDLIQRCSANPITKDGEVIGAVVVYTDVTAQRRAAAQREAALQLVAEQSERLGILHEIDRSILAARLPADIAQPTAMMVRRVTNALTVSVSLVEAGAKRHHILAADGPIVAEALPDNWQTVFDKSPASEFPIITDVAALPNHELLQGVLLGLGIRSYTALPLKVGDEVLGFLHIGRAETGQLAAGLLDFVTQVADSLAVAFHNARLDEQVRNSRGQLQALARRRAEMQERDRRYIADQLYNEAGQVLAALILQLGLFERSLGQGLASPETLAEMKNTADRVLHDLHDLATNLRPVSLDQLGLASALQQYARQFGEQYGVRVRFAARNMERVRVPDQIETALYRIAQDALTNVAQHAAAQSVDIVLGRTDQFLVLSITDDGVGFDVEAGIRRGALGLVGLVEQAEALGGTLTIEGAPGAGTSITARVPLSSKVS